MFRRAHNISKPEDFKSLTADDFEGAGRCVVALKDKELDAVPKAAQSSVLLKLSEAACKQDLPGKVRENLAQRVLKMVRSRDLHLYLCQLQHLFYVCNYTCSMSVTTLVLCL